jgi:N-acetylglucosamine-6-phosphate deacetylase
VTKAATTLCALTADGIFDGLSIKRGAALILLNDRVVEVVQRLALPGDMPLADLGGAVIAPGLVDVQVNGGGGVLFNAEPTPAGVRAIAQAHRGFGTTALLPTIITDSPAIMEQGIAAVAAARAAGVPGIVGIHLEGPFLDPVRKGAHPAEHVRQPVPADIERLIRLASRDPQDCGVVLVTLAPNIVAPADIERLARAGIIVSLGHADATSAEAVAALAAGARGFTHLYNAMSQLSHRAPGMVGAALASPAAYCGLIVDGHHVDPVAAQAAIMAKGSRRIVLISDAMPSAAGGPDRFQLQGRDVRRSGTRLTLGDGTLAGATITLADAVIAVQRDLGFDQLSALAMATRAPAEFLDAPSLGRIECGTAVNDLIVWSSPLAAPHGV